MVLDMNFRSKSHFLDVIFETALRITANAEVGLVTFDVKFSCICRSQCQLLSSFIVFVNLYARVLVSKAPDVVFKYLIFHDSMANL